MSANPPNAATLTLYSKPACVQCNATKRRLDAAGVPYVTIDVSVDGDARAYVAALGYSTVPVCVTPAGDHWGGYRDGRIDGYAATVNGVARRAAAQ